MYIHLDNTLQTDYKMVGIIYVLFFFRRCGIVSYQNGLYYLAEITMGLFEKRGSISYKKITNGKSKW